ncbi:MAG TPA: hypothetical protein VJ841_05355 [Candidatus Saccharimonadales bacterium]|nr:hypothetical protein [Candidatus Saccharimonadales bacterium]
MSEVPSSSPDTEPKPSSYVEGAPDALQIDKIEELRRAEDEYEQKMVDEAEWTDIDARIEKRRKAREDFPKLIEEHLKANGVAEDDPMFGNYVDLLRDFSVDNIPEGPWSVGEVDDDGTKRPALKAGALEKIRERYGSSTPDVASDAADSATDTPEADDADKETDTPDGDKDKDDDTKVLITPESIKNTVDTDPAIVAARANVDAAKSDLAVLTAQKQGRLFNRKLFGNEKAQQAYADAQERYEAAVQKLTTLELAAEKTAGMERDDETERLDAVFKLIGHYQGLQEETIAALQNTKVGKFVTWMTSGGTVKRIVKGVGVGLLAGGVAAAVTGLTGGAAGTVIAGAAVGASRFGRAYARFDNKAGRGMQVVDADSKMSAFSREVANEAKVEGIDQTTAQSADVASGYLMDLLDKETAREQGKRRKSTMKALGLVAIGGTAAEGISYLTDHFGSPGIFGGDHDTSAGSHHEGAGSSNGDTPGVGAHETPPATGGETAPDWNDAKWADARTISPGEGMYQTFHEMNIPEKDWSSLMEKVGPDLHNMQDVNGNPLAYRLPNGDWGLHMTPDGKMPTGALDAINNAHEHMQGTGSSAEAAADTAPSSASHVDTDTTSGTGASAETTSVDMNPASPEDLQHSIDHSQINELITNKETLTATDITGNQELMDLSHVATYASPDVLGRRLGLSAAEWNNLNSYIIEQVRGDNRLYTDAFSVDNAGYLHFTQNRVPANTMAAILSRIPMSSRYGLAA